MRHPSNKTNNKYLRLLHSHGRNTRQELDHFDGMTSMAVVEIEPVSELLDVCRILVCIVFENQLLEPDEGSFVRHFLTDLDHCFPLSYD